MKSDLVEAIAGEPSEVHTPKAMPKAAEWLSMTKERQIHKSGRSAQELFISLDRGILTLKLDGTWDWSDRPGWADDAAEGGPGSASGRGDSWENPGHDLGR